MRVFPLSALGPILELFGASPDRRRADRHACDARTCNLGEIIDFSSTGARIRCRRFYRPKTGRRVLIQVPASLAGPAVSIHGTICWVNLENGEWHAGVAFDQTNETAFTASPAGPEIPVEKPASLFRPDWSN